MARISWLEYLAVWCGGGWATKFFSALVSCFVFSWYGCFVVYALSAQKEAGQRQMGWAFGGEPWGQQPMEGIRIKDGWMARMGLGGR